MWSSSSSSSPPRRMSAWPRRHSRRRRRSETRCSVRRTRRGVRSERWKSSSGRNALVERRGRRQGVGGAPGASRREADDLRQRGNEAYRRGDGAEAETACKQAIDALQSCDIALVEPRPPDAPNESRCGAHIWVARVRRFRSARKCFGSIRITCRRSRARETAA